MKIFAGYKPTDKPWGGANNFLRALYYTLQKNHGAQIVFEPAADCDVFFFCQLGKGPANNSANFTLENVKDIAALNVAAPTIMRMVNMRRHTSHKYPVTYWLNRADRAADTELKNAAGLCHGLIFQSTYQKETMLASGLKPNTDHVIHNGAAEIFSTHNGVIPKYADGKLKLFSSAVSTKGLKNHGIIAEIANDTSVEVSFAGVWPEGIPSGNIKMLGRLDHAAILETARTSHYFLHPSIKEACSNSIVESLAMGLPVLYGTQGSSREVVGPYGMMVHSRDIAIQIEQAKKNQPGLVDLLAANRSRYSMDTAAAAYYKVFEDAIKSKRAG